jgi:hypothetical protein
MQQAMRSLLVATLALPFLLVADAKAGGGKVRVDPGFSYPGYARGHTSPPVRVRPPRAYLPPRPSVTCDAYGRCWRSGYPHYGRYGARPPGWADDLPARAQDPYRFVRPSSGVVCDRSTSVCYKQGRVDKSETETYFGTRAADRADDLRDDLNTGRLFVPERGITCDPGRRICFDQGVADFSTTRRYFGSRAAELID